MALWHGGYDKAGSRLAHKLAITGHHRKHAARLLRGKAAVTRSGPRPGRRTYDEAVREALVTAWEAGDRICGKRLKVLLPSLVEAMERHGHLVRDPVVRTGLLTMSATTIDRALAENRAAAGRKRRRVGASSAVRRAVPVRTFDDWNDPAPGYVEADLVLHCGASPKGSYLQTLTLTDIATGWTECAPLMIREQVLLTKVLDEAAFPAAGLRYGQRHGLHE